MKWKDLSDNAGNILEWLESPYSNKMKVLTLRKNEKTFLGGKEFLVDEILFNEILYYVRNGEDVEDGEIVIHYASGDLLVFSLDFNEEINKLQKYESMWNSLKEKIDDSIKENNDIAWSHIYKGFQEWMETIKNRY